MKNLCFSVDAAIVGLGMDYSTATVKHTNVISRQARLSWWFIFKRQNQITLETGQPVSIVVLNQ